MKKVTIEDYGASMGALWFQQMLDEGWLLDPEGIVEVNVQQCRDMVALAEETDYLYFGDEGEDADETKIAFQMLIACIDQVLDDWGEAVTLAAQFISEEVVPE